MNIVLMYIYPLDARETFLPHARSWVSSYRKFPPGEQHKVVVCLPNGIATDQDKAIFSDIVVSEWVSYEKPGWDIGAYQAVADCVDGDLMVFFNSRCRFWKAGWLPKFVAAYAQFGPKGLYGNSGSYERCPVYTALWPNPHIRTSCFATNPRIFKRYPYRIHSRDEGFKFESGEWNLSHWYEDHGWPVKVVAWDGIYDKTNWRKPQNMFRSGNQTNCLIWDRHTDIFSQSDENAKRHLNLIAGVV